MTRSRIFLAAGATCAFAAVLAACVPATPGTTTTTTTTRPTTTTTTAPPPPSTPACGALRTWPSGSGVQGAAAIAPAEAAVQAHAAATAAVADPAIPGDANSVPLVVTAIDPHGRPRIDTMTSDDPADAAHDAQLLTRWVDGTGGDVVAVQPARPVTVSVEATATNDPQRGDQWALTQLGFENVWAASPHGNGSGACVAVVDTGIQTDHPDLAGRVVASQDYTGEGAGDGAGHGTHVAGIVAAGANNGIGVAGAAPGAQLLNVKVLASNGSGLDSWVAQGVVWAVDHGATVVNLSLGAACPPADAAGCATAAMLSAVNYAEAHNVVVVAAAGNNGRTSDAKYGYASWPAAFGPPITVAATDSARNLADFSSRGVYVDVAAPGVSILSTYKGSTYAWLSGTSMATPYVTALVADLRAAHPAETAAQIRARIETTASDLGPAGWDQGFGWGLINPVAADAG